jgi:hypothetical protein
MLHEFHLAPEIKGRFVVEVGEIGMRRLQHFLSMLD